MSVAERARDERDVLLSASLFNRALAYKPHDSELVAAVARFTKQRAWVKRLRIVTIWGVTALAFAAVTLWATRLYNSRMARRNSIQAKVVATPVPKLPQTTLPMVSASQYEARDVPTRDMTIRRASLGRDNTRRVNDAASVGQSSITRSVQIVITGASGGRLLIDGAEQPWFGVRHELTTGLHRFEVIAPNEGCCVPSQPKLIEVSPGKSDQKDISGYRVSGKYIVRARSSGRHVDLR